MNKDQPFVTIVLSNYNGEDYLRPAIDSVLSQDYENFELILVDDGSSDNSKEILQSYADNRENVKFIGLSENQGQANGFNVGVAKAKGELVSFMDSDDLWYSNKLTNVVGLYNTNPNAVLFQHNLYIRREDNPTKTRFKPVLYSGNLLERLQLTNSLPQFSPTAGLTFTKEVLEKVGPIPLEFRTCADGYITRTAMCFGDVCSVNQCWGEYRLHQSNATAENKKFSSKKYVDELLLPQLNKFYVSNKIDFDYLKMRHNHTKRFVSLEDARLIKRCIVALAGNALYRLSENKTISSMLSSLSDNLAESLNVRRIIRLRNKHHNKRAFIIGTASCQNIDELNKLKKEITFAGNNIFSCFNQTDWRPSYYSVVDNLFAKDNCREIRKLRGNKIYPHKLRNILSNEPNVVWINDLEPLEDKDGNRYFRLSDDIYYGVHDGSSVEFFQIQLAIYMGIKEVYLLNAKGIEVESEMQKKALRAAKEYAEKNGISIFSVSKNEQQDIVEHMDLDCVLGGAES